MVQKWFSTQNVPLNFIFKMTLTLSTSALFSEKKEKTMIILNTSKYGYPRIFSILFFNRGLVIDEKGQNPKAQPSIIKTVALRNY